MEWAEQFVASQGQKAAGGCGRGREGSSLPFSWILMGGGAVEHFPLWLPQWPLGGGLVWGCCGP